MNIHAPRDRSDDSTDVSDEVNQHLKTGTEFKSRMELQTNFLCTDKFELQNLRQR